MVEERMVEDEMIEENGKVESSDQAPRMIETSAPSSQEDNQETATSSSTYRCSAPCNKRIKNTYNANLHPVLGVLLCRECYVSYGDGDFSKLDDGIDDNGDDNFCRWCCDGGDLIGCYSQDENGYTCHNVFCKECIAKNVPSDEVLARVEEDPSYQWICYACDLSKLDNQRRRAAQIMRELSEAEFIAEKQTEELTNGIGDREATSIPPTPPREPSPDIPVAMIEDKQTEKPTNGLTNQQAPTILPEAPQEATREPSPDIAVEMVEMVEDEPTEKPTNGLGNPQATTIEPQPPQEPPREPSPDIPVAMVEDTPPPTSLAVVLLNQSDLDQRLKYFSGVKEACMSEITSKFDLIIEAFQTGHSDKRLMSLTGKEIESLRRPILDLSEMLNNLQDLSKSYSSPALDYKYKKSANLFTNMSDISDNKNKPVTSLNITAKDFKEMILKKLTNHQWYQNQVLACKTYVENNGTKSTTLEEIRDFLLPTALKSFPKPVKDEMIDEIQVWYEKFSESLNQTQAGGNSQDIQQ